MIYYVDAAGGPIATAGAPECMGAVWNPSSTRRIKLLQFGLLMRDFDLAGNTLYLARTSTRGTAGSTVTPDADNSESGDGVPPSGFVVDLAEYSVQPTIVGDLYSPFTFSTGAGSGDNGSGFSLPLPRGITIPPGTGIGIFEKQGNTFGGDWDVNCVVDD